MSDDRKIIDAFIGDYESDGDLNDIPPQHQQWVPVAGVQMKIASVGMVHDAAKAYAKITIDSSPAQGAIEKTAYRAFCTDTLVGQDIEIARGIVLSRETLIVVRDATGKRTGVRHELEFADGTHGKWLCPDKPKLPLPLPTEVEEEEEA
jgi:hypothetical protein